MFRILMAAAALGGLALAAAPAWAQAEPTPRAYLGIVVEPSADADRPGVAVREAAANSPAAKAGLQRGDVIVKVGDESVKDFDALIAMIGKHRPGDKLTFHVRRDGQDKELTVTLAARQDGAPAGGAATEKREAFLGVHTQQLTPEVRTRLGVSAETGALVAGVAPDSSAAKAGVKRGDVIVAFNDKAVTDPVELRRLVREAGVGQEVRLTVQRGAEKKELTAKLQEAPVDGVTLFPMPPMPRLPGGLREVIPPILNSPERIAELEKKIQDLERRVRELEGKQKPPSP